VIIVVSESTDGIEVTGSGVVISVLEGIVAVEGGGVSDHGALTGLADDDHTQYHTDARGDARYWPLSTDLATQAELDAHISDTTDAHALAGITGLQAALDLKAALTVTDALDARLDTIEGDNATQSELDAHAAAADPHTGYIKESDYDANTILAATTDNTPAALTVAASRIVGRKASGDISAMTAAELWALLAAGTGQPEVIGVALSDETTTITTGTAKVTMRMPFAMILTAVRASLSTVSTSGIPTVDINEGGTTVLSTKLTIDANELTSTTAATAAVISDPNLADDAEITFDIDVAGTGAKGLKVWLIGTRA
jgi:hypothetical protein